MALVVPFSGYIPPDHSVAWTSVEVQEASAATGTWTAIDTIAAAQWTPAGTDTDPSEPLARAFETDAATGPGLFYRVVWIDGTGGRSLPSDPVQFVTSVKSQLRPSAEELAELVRSRTVDDQGEELGVFSDQTRPTHRQAGGMIDRALDLVVLRVGESIPPRLYVSARAVVALLAAQLVEASYYPENADDQQSAFALYKGLYEQAIVALEKAILGDEASSQTPRWATVQVTGVDGWVTPQWLLDLYAQQGLLSGQVP